MLKRILSTLLSALLGAGMLLPASAATTPVLSGETNDYTSTCEYSILVLINNKRKY